MKLKATNGPAERVHVRRRLNKASPKRNPATIRWQLNKQLEKTRAKLAMMDMSGNQSSPEERKETHTVRDAPGKIGQIHEGRLLTLDILRAQTLIETSESEPLNSSLNRQERYLPLLERPDAVRDTGRLSREDEATLIKLHVKPFIDWNTLQYPRNTGTRKHRLPRPVVPFTSYIPVVDILIVKTGALKCAWSAGVDQDTSYTNDAMIRQRAEKVREGYHKGLMSLPLRSTPPPTVPGSAVPSSKVKYTNLPAARGVLKTATHLPVIRTAVMGELHETANSNVVLESKPTYSAALKKEPKPVKSVRKTVRFAASALKTSEQPTFISHTTSLVSGSSASN